jgi:serine/threonine protein kinase
VIDSPYWTAPEVLASPSGARTLAMDVWSLGIISIEMVQRKPPYFDMNPHFARQLIVARGTPTLKDPEAFPWDLLDFLSSCLVVPVRKRATMPELCLVGLLFMSRQ